MKKLLKRILAGLTAGALLLSAALPAGAAADVRKWDEYTCSYVITGSTNYVVDTKNRLLQLDADGKIEEVLLSNIVNVQHTMLDKSYWLNYAVSKTGNLYMWGRNEKGQAGDGTGTDSDSPQPVMGGVKQVLISGNTVMAVTTKGNLYAWGETPFLLDSESTQFSPLLLQKNIKKAVAAGKDQWYAIDNKNRLVAYYNLDAKKKSVSSVAKNVTTEGVPFSEKGKSGMVMPVLDNVVDAWGAGGDLYTLDSDNNLRLWRSVKRTESKLDIISVDKKGNAKRGLVKKTITETKPYFTLANIASFTAYGDDSKKGLYHCYAITESGNLVSWGTNTTGLLGDGTKVTRDVTKNTGKKDSEKVYNISGGVVAAGNGIALKSDGSVIAWGMSFAGKTTKNPKATVIGKGLADVDLAGGYVEMKNGKLTNKELKDRYAQGTDGLLYSYDETTNKLVKMWEKPSFKLRAPTKIA